MSDPQCGTIREVGIKAKKCGGLIREAVLIERTALLKEIRYT